MLCLFHDLPEARTGDFNYVNRLYDTSRERDALEDAVEGTGLEEDIMSIWDEHACRTTPESLLAHDADQLDLILNLKRESDLGNRYADKWLESAVERLRTDIAKELAQTILKTDHTDWWYLGPDRNWWERKSCPSRFSTLFHKIKRPPYGGFFYYGGIRHIVPSLH